MFNDTIIYDLQTFACAELLAVSWLLLCKQSTDHEIWECQTWQNLQLASKISMFRCCVQALNSIDQPLSIEPDTLKLYRCLILNCVSYLYSAFKQPGFNNLNCSVRSQNQCQSWFRPGKKGKKHLQNFVVYPRLDMDSYTPSPRTQN